MKKFDAVLFDGEKNAVITSWFCETFKEADDHFSEWRAKGVIDQNCKTIEDTELKYMVFVKEILDNSVRVIYDYKNRPIQLFKINDDTHIPVRILQTDDFYYGKCEVRTVNINPDTLEIKDCFGSLTVPITSELMSCEDFLNKYKPAIKFEEFSKRKYGQPKLSKPAPLKGVKQFGTTKYNHKCTCPVFVLNNDVWVKHNDYFSEMFRPPAEDIGKPLSHIAKKYFNKSTSEKLLYANNWASVVLRNEAWLCLKNLAKQIQIFDKIQVQFEVQKAVNAFYKSKYSVEDVLDGINDMSRFYENLVHLLHKSINTQGVSL